MATTRWMDSYAVVMAQEKSEQSCWKTQTQLTDCIINRVDECTCRGNISPHYIWSKIEFSILSNNHLNTKYACSCMYL